MGTQIPSEIIKARKRYEEKVAGFKQSTQSALTDSQSFSDAMSSEFSGRLKEYNDRNVDQVNKHLETIKSAISADIKGSVELRFGGSVAKHTAVNGLSDNDMLVLLNDSSLAKKNPREVQEYFKSRLKNKIPNAEVSVGKLAVTVKFKKTGEEIQLLPAVKTATGIRIADPTVNKWSSVVKPQKFAKELTTVNQQNDGKVVPVIKLVKPIIDALPKSQHLKGYHVEALATEIFKTYTGPKTEEKMVDHFFKQASRRILYPIKDGTGQSEYIDDRFGKRNSPRRVAISKAFSEIDYRMEEASERKSINKWRDILDGK
jgi:hypothetical protein